METTLTHSILIIDDDLNDVAITQSILAETGRELEITAVSSGEAALELLRSTEDLPSEILLDIKMTGVDGIEILCEIRAPENLKRLPVVVVTKSSLQADREKAFAAGADGFLKKSFNIDQFSYFYGRVCL
jgi:CheY-like chemotaxis protein